MNDKLLMERKRLYDEVERFSGMPTLEYDDILRDLERKIVQIEEQLTETCDVCGGEKLMYGPANKMVYGLYDPPNGLCEGTGDCDSAFEKAWREVKIVKFNEEFKQRTREMGDAPMSSYGITDYESLDSYGNPIGDYTIPTHLESSQPLREFIRGELINEIALKAEEIATHGESNIVQAIEDATGMSEGSGIGDSNMIDLIESVKDELVEKIRQL